MRSTVFYTGDLRNLYDKINCIPMIERLNQLVKLSLNSNFKIFSGYCNFWKYSSFSVDYFMMQSVLYPRLKKELIVG
jgi:hypothetical protein